MANFCSDYLRSAGSTVQLIGGTYPEWSKSSSCQCTATVSHRISPFYISTVLQLVEQNFTAEESVEPTFVECRSHLSVDITSDTRNTLTVCPSDDEMTHKQFATSLPVGETFTVNMRLQNPNLRNIRANVMLPGINWRDVTMTCSEIPRYVSTNNSLCPCPYTGYTIPGRSAAAEGLDNTAKILIGVLVPVGLLILCALLLLMIWFKFGKRNGQTEEKNQQGMNQLDMTSSSPVTAPDGQINGGFRSASLVSATPEHHSSLTSSITPYPGSNPSGFNNGLDVRRPIYQNMDQPSVMSGRNSASESMSIPSDKVTGHGELSPYGLIWAGAKSTRPISPRTSVALDGMRVVGSDNVGYEEDNRSGVPSYMETELNDPAREHWSGEIVKQLLSRPQSSATVQYDV